MEALKAIKIIGNQNDGRAVFLFLPNTGKQRVLNFMRDPKLAHILVSYYKFDILTSLCMLYYLHRETETEVKRVFKGHKSKLKIFSKRFTYDSMYLL